LQSLVDLFSPEVVFLMPPSDSPFIRFLIARRSALPDWHRLDAGTQRLLETILFRKGLFSDKPTVGELLRLSDLGGQSSIHKRLQILLTQKYIRLVTHPDDLRVKQVDIARKGESLLIQMDEAILLASTASSPSTKESAQATVHFSSNIQPT
jgi:hypothetical protein